MYKHSIFGFTLIELLVVISIIGILATVGLNTFPATQSQARNSQRKSDLNQYRAGLESYANLPVNTGRYPGGGDGSGNMNAATLCNNVLKAQNLMSACPEDPKVSSQGAYRYSNDGISTLATKYVLWGKLEVSNDYWVICSDGRIGVKSSSGFSVTNGNCPL